MAIEDEDIQRVRAATDMVALVSSHLSLRKVGQRWVGLCPFHNENTPSFSVNASEGLYYCFGCGASGDAITFVREIEHLDFVGAVEHLAEKANIQLRYTDAADSQRRGRRNELTEVLARAVDFYHRRLLDHDDARAARAYLRSRGFDGDVVRRYQVGWAPEGWDTLARSLDVPRELFVDAGLGYVNRRGGLNDSFRSRVLFPVFDPSGKPIGFGGRILPGGEGPKYKNSSETPLYAKSKVLYGLNWAKKPAVERNRLIVCEGYTDVIGFGLIGVEEAVATCGTALTEDHIKLMKRFAPRLVLAFDADAAGQNAAGRVYAWEQKYGVEVSVAALEPGRDPGELAGSDPEALRAAVDGARPFLGFRVARALASGDLDSPEARARTAEAALAVIAEHPNELVRDQYLMEVAGHTRIAEDQLRARLTRPRPTTGVETAESGVRAPIEIRRGPELEALKLLVHRPGEISQKLSGALFATPVLKDAYRALVRAGSLHDAISVAGGPSADVLSRLAVEESDADAADVIALLVEHAAQRTYRSLTDRVRADGTLDDYAELLAWLRHRTDELHDEHMRPAAIDALAGWFAGQDETAA